MDINLKTDPLTRLQIVAELELKTGYSWEYLNKLDDDKLLELLKERG